MFTVCAIPSASPRRIIFLNVGKIHFMSDYSQFLCAEEVMISMVDV